MKVEVSAEIVSAVAAAQEQEEQVRQEERAKNKHSRSRHTPSSPGIHTSKRTLRSTVASGQGGQTSPSNSENKEKGRENDEESGDLNSGEKVTFSNVKSPLKNKNGPDRTLQSDTQTKSLRKTSQKGFANQCTQPVDGGVRGESADGEGGDIGVVFASEPNSRRIVRGKEIPRAESDTDSLSNQVSSTTRKRGIRRNNDSITEPVKVKNAVDQRKSPCQTDSPTIQSIDKAILLTATSPLNPSSSEPHNFTSTSKLKQEGSAQVEENPTSGEDEGITQEEIQAKNSAALMSLRSMKLKKVCLCITYCYNVFF